MLSSMSGEARAARRTGKLPTTEGRSPTPEQEQIILAATRGGKNLFIDALAGTGKTTTLVMAAKALPPGPKLALAFNVKNKKDLEARLPSDFEVKTFNSLGHSAWAKACGKRLILDDRKIGRLVTAMAKSRQLSLSDDWSTVVSLVSRAMNAGLVPDGCGGRRSLIPDALQTWIELADQVSFGTPLSEPLLNLARDVLVESIAEAKSGTISFDDQIYMSAMFGGVFPRFPLVIVDEAQDLSPLNHIQVHRVASERLIIVGDPRQAIYQFRGADSSSMRSLRALRPEWIDLKLSVTFRCPKAIVDRQQAHAPGYTAAPSNPPGSIVHLPKKEGGSWDWDELPEGPTFVLCRNNAPLVSLAFRLIRRNLSLVMLGRDIGKGLVALSKKVIPDDTTSSEDCARAITEWRDRECNLARASDNEGKVAGITDRAECLLAVLSAGNPVTNAKELRLKLQDLFGRESGKITLSSIHRSKGLESQIVVHLDPWRIPSKQALRAAESGNPAPLEQENNLRYVCETRTMDTLVLANYKDFI